jgi:hypothetical protein
VITEIRYHSEGMLSITAPETEFDSGQFLCPTDEYNRHHEGIWNSRVLAFVKCKHDAPDATFRDGVPVAAYEGWN